ncbi:MAG: hypothetical protein NTW29_05800 [Bacteroidetes bacterium]|nr:hypothetical protein [Bacteroidota bacterium]
MRKQILLLLLLTATLHLSAQELYVFSEPASNVPSKSISIKLKEHFVTSDNIYSRFSQRFMPQVMAGLSKKLMVRAGVSISNMHTPNVRYESFNLYAKYRFWSKDELHKHFRMAVFADVSKTKAPFHYDEITLMGDKSGIEAGIIATQLSHKLAVSGTLSHIQVLDPSRTNKAIYIPERYYQSMNYSFSAGYLLLPREYSDYRQTNLNLYLEILGQQILDGKKSYVDIAPALQLIFNSNLKVNVGYRFQAAGNMQRMANSSIQISLERTFLNVLRKKS